jgi:hypothetical protein
MENSIRNSRSRTSSGCPLKAPWRLLPGCRTRFDPSRSSCFQEYNTLQEQPANMWNDIIRQGHHHHLSGTAEEIEPRD